MTTGTGPVEPVLEMNAIQGAAVPGFFKPHQTLLYIKVSNDADSIASFRWLLARLPVASAAETLADRRSYRQGDGARAISDQRVLTAVGFTYQGLAKLNTGALYIESEAFKQGLPARAALLGDPRDPAHEGHPNNWVVGATGAELDALIVLAGGRRDLVTAAATQLLQELSLPGVTVTSEDGDVREGAERGHEHFGFDDGVSQPGIRGRASEAAEDWITEREIAREEVPATWLYGNPGQELVWPGEFVLGYPSSSPDPLVPGLPSPTTPAWTKNGSFLVYRRLRQDVGLFWRTMRAEAQRLAAQPGFAHLTEDRLASMLVGRWPSGAPVSRVPEEDNPDLGNDELATNHFRFDSDTPQLALAGGHVDNFPRAKADPLGVSRCPVGAHIRKVNPRDASSDMGGASGTSTRRILRVGVPFGKSLADRHAEVGDDAEGGDRGLLFLAIQSSLDEQFEFLQARWINDETRPKMPGGHDMLVGQNAATRDGVRRCAIFGSDLTQAEVTAADQWIVPTGGGYFFLPSLPALRDIIGLA